MPSELEAAVTAARAAAELLRAGFGQRHHQEHKGPIDVVTAVDRAAEARIFEVLSRATPNHGFCSEEGPPIAGTTDARWIVDPLDGTTNYARGCPEFCVSIALEQAGQLELGVIYDPLREELFVAQRGAGARLNGRAIHVSTTEELARAVVSSGFPYDAWTTDRDNAAELAYFLKRVLALRVTGSAALDLAAVACGRRDAHWEPGLAAHDVAAGALLVRESGGLATDYEGNDDAVYGSEIVAANPRLHRAMLAYLRVRHCAPHAPDA